MRKPHKENHIGILSVVIRVQSTIIDSRDILKYAHIIDTWDEFLSPLIYEVYWYLRNERPKFWLDINTEH